MKHLRIAIAAFVGANLIGGFTAEPYAQQTQNNAENLYNRANSFNTASDRHQGDIMPENNEININVQGDLGTITGIDTGNQSTIDDLSTISGNVTNAINQLPASPPPEQEGIRELLETLQRMIEGDDNLKSENKEQALEQVQALAETGKNPAIEDNKQIANSAIMMLKGLMEEVPKAVNFIEACNTFLPQIETIFGLE